MRNLLIGLCLVCSSHSMALAKSQTMPSRKASPEVRKLGYYVGTWVGSGETKGGPLGSAGKLSSRQTCTWFVGGFQVLCEGEERGPSGRRHFLNVLAYDEASKAYTEYSVSSFGEAEYDRGGSLVGGGRAPSGRGPTPRWLSVSASVAPLSGAVRRPSSSRARSGVTSGTDGRGESPPAGGPGLSP